ncbi:Uncharacterised protein [Chlamydia trachomatis]|nr:Uncharacterised protein [Chlamydia trachomatis]
MSVMRNSWLFIKFCIIDSVIVAVSYAQTDTNPISFTLLFATSSN